MDTLETILLATDARGVATLTLNRPDKHNAMNAQMIFELTKVANFLSTNKKIRAVVLAASGKSFCAGGDLGWMKDQADKDRAGKIIESNSLASMLAALNQLPVPLIARVQGPAYGGGLGLMSVCDVAIAVEGIEFGLSETRLGLIPATIGPFVVRRIGEGFARQVFFNGKFFDTEMALRSGLVSAVCNREALDAMVESEIKPILECAPGAVADAKALCLTLGIGTSGMPSLDTAEALADRWETEEAKLGIQAFFERVAPPWKS